MRFFSGLRSVCHRCEVINNHLKIEYDKLWFASPYCLETIRLYFYPIFISESSKSCTEWRDLECKLVLRSWQLYFSPVLRPI